MKKRLQVCKKSFVYFPSEYTHEPLILINVVWDLKITIIVYEKIYHNILLTKIISEM